MSKAAIIEELRSKITHLERGVAVSKHGILPAPTRELAEFLPDRGLRLGSFIEIIGVAPGTRAISLALLLAKHIVDLRPRWAVLDSAHSFNPSSSAYAGWSADDLSLIRCDVSRAAWVFSQLLKSREIGLAIAILPNMDNMVFRRFQLSAERGEGLGIIVRPHDALKRPCWSSIRLLAESASGRKVRVSLLHSRGSSSAAIKNIEVSL